MLPTTTARVPEHTPDRYNDAIRRQTEDNLARCANQGLEAIVRRLAVIDQEWDIERMLEANAASAALIGLGLGAFVDRRFLALPILVAGFLLQHSLQGWCPPVALLRRLGVRTAAEIEQERYALKALRGDFYDVHQATEGPSDGKVATQALEAVRR